MFHGEEAPLALVCNTPRDGISIETLVVLTPYHHKVHHE